MTDLLTSYLTERIAELRKNREGWPLDSAMRTACTTGILELKQVQEIASASAEREQRLREMLTQAIARYAVSTEDGPMCFFCDALWEYEDDSVIIQTGSIWHEDGCLVGQARAVLTATQDTP